MYSFQTVPSVLFSLYLIAANPGKQEKLRAEVMKHVPPGTPVTSQALDKMIFLRACIKEGFRYQLGWTTVSVKECQLNIEIWAI